VIDFSDVGIGDPACDCIIAWSLLNAESRKIFRASLNNMDDDTWERGRGWALSIALIILTFEKLLSSQGQEQSFFISTSNNEKQILKIVHDKFPIFCTRHLLLPMHTKMHALT
jgi:aminoglycoside phosphotransferase (APT) family kinase protein